MVVELGGKKLKRIVLTAVVFCILSFFMFGYLIVTHHGFNIPIGYIKKEEFYDKQGWMDFTDYCKYYYNDKTAFENNVRYKQISESDIDTIRGYFDNFKSRMEAGERTDEYDFDINCISDGDYVLIKTKEGSKLGSGSTYGKYDDYTVYFFDTDSCTLYYITSNI